MKKFQSTCQNCTNKFCTKLSTEVREEIFKNNSFILIINRFLSSNQAVS